MGGDRTALLLARYLDIDDIIFISVKKGKVVIKELPPLKDKLNLVVDDILDTGNTR